MQAGWGDTADEIILKVFQHLTTGKDLFSVGLQWNRVAATDELWHSMYFLVQSSSSVRVEGESSYASLKSLVLKIKHEEAKRAVLEAGRAELRLKLSAFSDAIWVNIAVVGEISNDIRQLSHVFARRQTLERQHLCDVPYHVRFEGDVFLRIFHKFGDLGGYQTPRADVCIMLYSTHDYSTLEKAFQVWNREVKEVHPNALVVLVGTEDKEREGNSLHRPACDEDAKEIANRMGAVGWLKCCHTTGENVDLVFQTAALPVLQARQSASQITEVRPENWAVETKKKGKTCRCILQ